MKYVYLVFCAVFIVFSIFFLVRRDMETAHYVNIMAMLCLILAYLEAK